MPSPTLEERLRVLETLEPAVRPANRVDFRSPPRPWHTGRTLLATVALVGVLIGGVLVAGSTKRGSTQAAPSAAAKTVTPVPLEAAVIAADGRAETPEPARSRLATVNAALDDCLTRHGASKRPIGGGGFAYDDPGGQAAAACKVVAAKAESVTGGKEAQAANARRSAAQHAYGACVINDPNATPKDVAAVSGSPAGVACRTLINAVADDDGVLAAIVTATTAARPVNDGGHFTLTWAGRVTRDLAAPAVGLHPTGGGTGDETAVLVAFDGAFHAPPGAEASPPATAPTLVYQFDAEGRVRAYRLSRGPFVAPDTESLVATLVNSASVESSEAPASSTP
jgi:hypothetical protein